MSGERPSDLIQGLPYPASELPWSAAFVMQAIEILPVLQRNGSLQSLRPDCADSFIVGWPVGQKPEEVALAALAGLGLQPRVLHSTSWRQGDGEVVLTYIAVVSADSEVPESWEVAPVEHAELARGGTVTPPTTIAISQVLEHALRHLAWLVQEDATLQATLTDWVEALEDYVPEPFRALGGPPG